MSIDSSAIVAILRQEVAAELYANAIEAADHCRISAANYLEASIVIDSSRDSILSRKLDDLIVVGSINIDPVTEVQARLAREAYRDFGRGSGHPAQLNFGNCFAYALAKAIGEPLLFKGDDFTHTDVKPALPWFYAPYPHRYLSRGDAARHRS
jgi:ribonuclease VapC